MAYSDLNYASPKMIKSIFGLTDKDFMVLTVHGKFKFKRKYKNPLVLMDSLAAMYEDRENIVMKRWGYDFESPKEKFEKMMDTQLKGYPRCFFRVGEDVPEAYYRVFHNGEALKLCVFVYDGFARCLCFTREKEEHLMRLYLAFEEGKVDIEG